MNSQKSLADAVGAGFDGEAWVTPTGLLPGKFTDLESVSGPGDPGVSPKAAWRMPVVLPDKAAGVEIKVNCYCLRDGQAPAASGGTPAPPLREPDYRYGRIQFHGVRAATADADGQSVFALRDGEILFKVEASGGAPEGRRRSAAAAAQAIWAFRHPE